MEKLPAYVQLFLIQLVFSISQNQLFSPLLNNQRLLPSQSLFFPLHNMQKPGCLVLMSNFFLTHHLPFSELVSMDTLTVGDKYAVFFDIVYAAVTHSHSHVQRRCTFDNTRHLDPDRSRLGLYFHI